MGLKKHPGFRVRSETPYNGEPRPARLREHFVTPRELFYVRNHGNVPEVDPGAYRLAVDGMVERPLELELDRLVNDFPRRTVMATLECAGNRRAELSALAPTPGETPWETGAIGNAFWTGVPLKEILSAAGVRPGAGYVAMRGADDVERSGENVGFGGSLALDKALSGEVLIAYEMNGEPLAPEHGYPLRMIAPGYIGARSVKWLTRLRVQAGPSDNYFQARAYRLFPPGARAETVAPEAGLPLSETAVNAVICEPEDGARVGGRMVTVRGYALTGGGRKIARVDVSRDGGATWTTARITQGDQPWAWAFWEAELEPAAGENELCARAVDSAANTQPEDARHIWNFKGYMNNAWHRVRVMRDEG